LVSLKRQDVAVGVAVGAASGLLGESLGLHGALSYWGVRAPLILGFAVLSTVLWVTRLRALVALSGAVLALLWVPAMSRLLHALELLGNSRARRLVLTELPPPSRSYAEPARALMQALHLEGEIIAVGPVHDTRDEAKAVARLFAERGLQSLILVTSPTHTRRAAATFERQGLTVIASPAVETLFDLETLDTPDDRLRAWGSVLHERLGLWLYALRGDLAP